LLEWNRKAEVPAGMAVPSIGDRTCLLVHLI
jgi:hypothetical protein